MPSYTKDQANKRKEQQYFDLFATEKKSPGVLMEEIKEAGRLCKHCRKGLCIGNGVKWMCWSCPHNTFNTNKEEEWI